MFDVTLPIKVGKLMFSARVTMRENDEVATFEFGCGEIDDAADDTLYLDQTISGRTKEFALPAKTLARCFTGDGEILSEGDWLTVRTLATGKTLAAGRIAGNAVSWSSEFAPDEIQDESMLGHSFLYAAPVSRTGFAGRFLQYALSVDRAAKTVDAGEITTVK